MRTIVQDDGVAAPCPCKGDEGGCAGRSSWTTHRWRWGGVEASRNGWFRAGRAQAVVPDDGGCGRKSRSDWWGEGTTDPGLGNPGGPLGGFITLPYGFPLYTSGLTSVTSVGFYLSPGLYFLLTGLVLLSTYLLHTIYTLGLAYSLVLLHMVSYYCLWVTGLLTTGSLIHAYLIYLLPIYSLFVYLTTMYYPL